MTVNITIVGLGQIGTSAGLALAERKDLVTRLGHDRELRVAQQAQKMGALDKVAINLPSAVREADVVFLALPVDQVRDTLAALAKELKNGAVVMDTAPVKEITTRWARELMPPESYYVGLTPVINPAYLLTHESGIEAARADLFKQGMMAIVTPMGTPSEAIKLAADLVRLLGSVPFFADPVEVDSLMAATHLLPQLLAAALLNITIDQPGWREGRKMAGRAFAEVTGPVVEMGEPSALSTAAINNTENLMRVLDSVIASLNGFRNDLANQDRSALMDKLQRAREGRNRWWDERQAADWSGDEPSPSSDLSGTPNVFGRLMGVRKKKDQ